MKRIELIKERNGWESFNDSITFIQKNFKPLFNSLLSVNVPLIVIINSLSFLPDNILKSSLFNDIRGIVYNQENYLNFNPIVLFIFIFSTIIVTYYYLKLYKKNEGNVINIQEIYKKSKPNIASLICLSVILICGFSALISYLIYIDEECKLIFGFSLFYIFSIISPILILYVFSNIYIIITDEMNFFDALKKQYQFITKYLNIWVKIFIMLVGIYLLKSSLHTLLTLLYFFSTINSFYFFQIIIQFTEQIMFICATSFFSIYIAFIYISQEEKIKEINLLERIEEIK